ncbi:NBR1-Ig-like domain-containing protein [Paenibacillus taiwanensis]|uniref:NBR1-Ig-like domain-containing protein n=1 Tax=Paenibacillus taiwanensis TaxID=401638 RepID=UPI000411CC66|nr:NBR1-Ig-like domain-containing protein [Paenibacillus taiwanensis]
MRKKRVAMVFILSFMLLITDYTAHATVSANTLHNTFEKDVNDSLGMVVEQQSEVGGYLSGLPPEGSTVPSPDMGVYAKNGQYFYRIAGTDNSSIKDSFIYFKLYDELDLRIDQGMVLSYWIYHHGGQQSKKIAIDLIFDDNTTLRDSGVTDQNGRGVHPAFRNMPLSEWHFVQIKLDTFSGKKIKKVLVGYDDLTNDEVGSFRAYLDDIYIGPSQALDAKILTSQLPDFLYAGEEYTANITVKNAGSQEWSESMSVRLGAVDDGDPFALGRHVIPAGHKIKYGDTYTFTFPMKAPDKPGVYTTDWRMVQDGVSWFGDTVTKQVKVQEREVLNAKITTHKLPDVLYAGEEYTASITVENTGTHEWSESSSVRLGAVDDGDPFALGRHFIPAGHKIKYGSTYTFTFPMKAPDKPGVYTTDWRMVQDGVSWFGDTVTKQVRVKEKVNVNKDKLSTYYYDSNNQLAYIISANQKKEYVYDELGRLRSVSTSRNLIPNHSFERPDLWRLSPHMRYDSLKSSDGGKSIKFESEHEVIGTSSDSVFIPVLSSQKYVLSASLFNSLTKGSFYVDMLELDESNNVVLDHAGYYSGEQHKWNHGTVAFVTNSKTVHVLVRVVADSGATGTAYADNIKLERAKN